MAKEKRSFKMFLLILLMKWSEIKAIIVSCVPKSYRRMNGLTLIGTWSTLNTASPQESSYLLS